MPLHPTSSMLLIQPLKIDDINIVIKDMDEDDEQPQQPQSYQHSVQLQPFSQHPQHPASLSPIDVIDDDELLAILGFPVSTSTSATSTTINSPVNEFSLLDWEDMPELSESEEEYLAVEPQSAANKRKFEDDIFAQYDFEEANPVTKKLCQHQLQIQPY